MKVLSNVLLKNECQRCCRRTFYFAFNVLLFNNYLHGISDAWWHCLCHDNVRKLLKIGGWKTGSVEIQNVAIKIGEIYKGSHRENLLKSVRTEWNIQSFFMTCKWIIVHILIIIYAIMNTECSFYRNYFKPKTFLPFIR